MRKNSSLISDVFSNPVLIGAVGSAALVPLTRRLARRAGLLTRPRPDRWGEKRTPLLGGLAIIAPVAVGSFLSNRALAPLLSGVWAVFGVGLWDDLCPLVPAQKVGGVAAGSILECLVSSRIRCCGDPFFYLDTLGRLLVQVGAANAFNLVDNMDGLGAGIAALSSAAAAVVLLDHGLDKPLLERREESCSAVGQEPGIAAALCGSSLGFLLWNRPPALSFMGDAGSLAAGYLLGDLAWEAASTAYPWRRRGAAPLKPMRVIIARTALIALLLAVPIIDSVLLFVRRWAGRRPLFKGNTDHLSHVLARRGLAEPLPVLLLQAAQCLACGAAVLVVDRRARQQHRLSLRPLKRHLPVLLVGLAIGVLMLSGRMGTRGD